MSSALYCMTQWAYMLSFSLVSQRKHNGQHGIYNTQEYFCLETPYKKIVDH